VRDLNGWYGESHVLHGISFDVPEGEVVTLLGRQRRRQDHHAEGDHRHSGAPDRFPAFRGVETVGLPARAIARRGIGYVPEERGIFASLDVEENLLLPPVIRPGGLSLDESSSCFRTSRSG
jgi:branched-chain amino acid transport system ATP-binding protein